jgi:hypothetical protein
LLREKWSGRYGGDYINRSAINSGVQHSNTVGAINFAATAATAAATTPATSGERGKNAAGADTEKIE